MGPFGYLSRQIFRDIQETQFSGSKMEVHVHLKNAFQAELETEGSRLATIFAAHPSPRPFFEKINPPDPINHVCQVNRFQKIILLVVQYKYLKSCSRKFYSPESDPPHKIMRYDVYYSTQLCCSFPSDRNLSHGNDLYWRCTSFEKAFRQGWALNILHDS